MVFCCFCQGKRAENPFRIGRNLTTVSRTRGEFLGRCGHPTLQKTRIRLKRRKRLSAEFRRDEVLPFGSRCASIENSWAFIILNRTKNERTLEANASAIALIGLALGAFVNKKFLILPGIVAGFLLQHALQGWCPPLPVFRRMGVRTSYEIEQERYALKAFRGDFGDAAGDVVKSAAAVGLKSNWRVSAGM